MMAAIEFAPLLADPVLARALGTALSVIFLTGAWQKWREPEIFRAALENYRLLPESVAAMLSALLPLWEAAAGVLLLLSPTRTIGGTLSVLLLLSVTAAVAINLIRGHTEIDCGCTGLGSHVGDQTLSWGLVARNLLMLAAVPLAVGEGSLRTLVWVDYITVTCGSLALVGLYVAANQLLANQPRLQGLRNS